ncbi:tryptophan-rich sensory protein [Streptomyces vietnamensis]|uniref:tryptophan-rich sensory protein n=1 Tax=Streptomyces vietnamensis TaxID=362257 RepID=UPI0034440553
MSSRRSQRCPSIGLWPRSCRNGCAWARPGLRFTRSLPGWRIPGGGLFRSPGTVVDRSGAAAAPGRPAAPSAAGCSSDHGRGRRGQRIRHRSCDRGRRSRRPERRTERAGVAAAAVVARGDVDSVVRVPGRAARQALPIAKGGDQGRLTARSGVNTALGASRTWLFFRCRSPGPVATFLLDVGEGALVRRTGRIAPTASRALVPHAAWCMFATA